LCAANFQDTANALSRQPRASISQGDIKEDRGSETQAGSRGGALVGGLGDEVPQKLKLFL